MENPEKKTTSVTPILAKWFHSGKIKRGNDNTITLDNFPIHNLQVVGRLLKYEIHSGKMFMDVEDGTGVISLVAHKLAEEKLPSLVKDVNLSTPGLYLRVVFSPQIYKGNITNIANKLQQVTDFNGLTFHLLSVIYSARFRKKKSSEAAKNLEGSKNSDSKKNFDSLECVSNGKNWKKSLSFKSNSKSARKKFKGGFKGETIQVLSGMDDEAGFSSGKVKWAFGRNSSNERLKESSRKSKRSKNVFSRRINW